MDYAMIVNYEYCTNCRSCEISCRKEKDISLDEWGIQVQQIGPAKFGDAVEWDYLPVPSSLCDMCAERIQAGKKAACELHCLADVIQIVPVEGSDVKASTPAGKTVVFLRNGN